MTDSCCQHHAPDDPASALSGAQSQSERQRQDAPISQPSTPISQPSFGVENPRGLDALAFDGETGEAVLIMVEPRPWDGTEQRLFQLQEKVNSYLSFALDGEMTDAFPHLAGKPVRLQLDCAAPPDSMTEHFITAVREHIALQDMKFAVRIVGEPAPQGEGEGGCGTGCGCHPADQVAEH